VVHVLSKESGRFVLPDESISYSERPPPPLDEEEIPFLNTQIVLEPIKFWLWVSTGAETKNDCPGEGQQQFTGHEPSSSQNVLFLMFWRKIIYVARNEAHTDYTQPKFT
jgi:hypothetical protein